MGSDQFSLRLGISYLFCENRVCYNMTTKTSNVSVEFAQPSDNSDEVVEKRKCAREEHMRKIKSIAGHVGLLIALMLYTAIGGLVSHV